MKCFAFCLPLIIGIAIAYGQDPVTTSPQFYKVLLENDKVRVLEYRLKPGEKEPMHSHSAGVVYELTGGKLKVTFPDGKTQEASGISGETFWRGPTTHALENVGDTEVHAIAVDVKTASALSGDAALDKAIQKANSEFLTAVKTGDAATIAAPYAERGVFVLPDGRCIQGRSEIEKMYRAGFEKSGRSQSTKLNSTHVVLDGDLAYESGNAEVGVMKEGKLTTTTSRYLTVWQRTSGGEWQIVRNIVLP